MAESSKFTKRNAISRHVAIQTHAQNYNNV